MSLIGRGLDQKKRKEAEEEFSSREVINQYSILKVWGSEEEQCNDFLDKY